MSNQDRHEVTATSVAAFLDKYYKRERYTGRGAEAAASLLQNHIAYFAHYGHDLISRHDSVTGDVVWLVALTP